eukprot:2040932-Amphidinium_carterae.1
MRDWLHAHKPPSSSVCLNSGTCVWQVNYKPPNGGRLMRKSFAWRTRGVKSCMEECLHWLWARHTEYTGEKPTWDE